MIDPVRREQLDVLAELSELNPDIRLGQWLINTVFFSAGEDEREPRNVEDDRLLVALKKELENQRGRARDRAA